MPNKELVLETWTSLKDKVGGLVDRLNGQKEISEQIVTSYQNKIKQKDQLVFELEKDLRELGGQIGSLEKTISSKENLIRNLEDKLETKEDQIYSLRTQISTLQSKNDKQIGKLEQELISLSARSIDNFTKKLIFLPCNISCQPNVSPGLMYTAFKIKEGNVNSNESLVSRTEQIHSDARTLLHIWGEYHEVCFIRRRVRNQEVIRSIDI